MELLQIIVVRLTALRKLLTRMTQGAAHSKILTTEQIQFVISAKIFFIGRSKGLEQISINVLVSPSGDVALSKIGIDFLPILYRFKNKRFWY